MVSRKQALFESLVRLRRVERELPPNRDLVAVQLALEQELGETVSRRLAASVLGVSHTALARWVHAGDIPLVHAATGGQGVPVAALLDLRESVEAERRAGRRQRHLLEPVMTARRDRAERLDARALLASEVEGDPRNRSKRRSLAYHRALARSPSRQMVDDARRQIWKWRLQGRIDTRYADRWEEVLRRSPAEVGAAISDDSQAASDLRQSTPFAGMLAEPERRKIFEQVR